MSVQDSIPWKKINRLYIAFATVGDGVLTDKTTGDSTIEETEQKIRNVVAFVGEITPMQKFSSHPISVISL